MSNNNKFFTKKMISFLICGVLGWVLCISSILWIKIDANKKEAAAIEQTAIETEWTDRATVTLNRQEPQETPAVSSARRFDTLTPKEEKAIDAALSTQFEYDAENDIYYQVVLSNNCLIFSCSTDDYVTASLLVTDALIEEGMRGAAEAQQITADYCGKRLNYGCAVLFQGEIIYFKDIEHGVLVDKNT